MTTSKIAGTASRRFKVGHTALISLAAETSGRSVIMLWSSLLWSSLLRPSLAMFVGLFLLGAFDFYAYSPRPSGVTLRSRQLAPIAIILLSLTAAGFSLHLHSMPNVESLIPNGANFAPRSFNSERLRLLTYPLVITSPFESVLIALTLVATAISVGETGMLGLAVLVIGITGGTALIANLLDRNSLMSGPFEVSCGLFTCSLLYFAKNYHDAFRAAAKRFLKGQYRDSSEKFARMVIPTTVLFSQALSILILIYLSRTPLKLELIAAAVGISIVMILWFSFIRIFSGPHWETTSLYFVSAIGGFVLSGLVVYFAPRGFDVMQWREDALTIRAQIRDDLVTAMASSEKNEKIVPENETAFAKRLAVSGQRLQSLVDRTNAAVEISMADQRQIGEMKLIGRMLKILERLHRARALVAEADRRTHSWALHLADAASADKLHIFWQEERPWIDAEFYSLSLDNQESLKAFLRSLNSDVERLTQAAFDVEIRRVDAWVDWATRQPRSQLPAMKLVATEEAVKLELLSTKVRGTRLQNDPRLSTLHRSLRRMASVSSTTNWE